MVIGVPTGPDEGEIPEMLGRVVTVNPAPLLPTPETVTTTGPVVAPLGTVDTTLVALQLDGVVIVPLNVTLLVPCVAPKFTPVIVTEVPTAPNVGAKPVILGAAATVNSTPLLASPDTFTTTFPVVAPFGTDVTILVELQLVGAAGIPLNSMTLDPCVVPKFVPVIVTAVPIEPDVVDRLVIPGAGVVTVKFTPLLVAPETVTTAFPVVAPSGTGATMLIELQLVGEAAVPLNCSVLVP